MIMDAYLLNGGLGLAKWAGKKSAKKMDYDVIEDEFGYDDSHHHVGGTTNPGIRKGKVPQQGNTNNAANAAANAAANDAVIGNNAKKYNTGNASSGLVVSNEEPQEDEEPQVPQEDEEPQVGNYDDISGTPVPAQVKTVNVQGNAAAANAVDDFDDFDGPLVHASTKGASATYGSLGNKDTLGNQDNAHSVLEPDTIDTEDENSMSESEDGPQSGNHDIDDISGKFKNEPQGNLPGEELEPGEKLDFGKDISSDAPKDSKELIKVHAAISAMTSEIILLGASLKTFIERLSAMTTAIEIYGQTPHLVMNKETKDFITTFDKSIKIAESIANSG